MGLKRRTYAHFSHALDIPVSAMGDDNEIIRPGVGIRRAETAEGT
jgi:hypothetical protein